MGVLIFPCPCQHLLFSDVNWCPKVLLCIFLMTNDVGHLFMCFRMNFCKNVIPVISLLKTFPKLHIALGINTRLLS